jgi:hypothetical protein
MVFNATFNNISVISWQSVLLVEETGVPKENHLKKKGKWNSKVTCNMARNKTEWLLIIANWANFSDVSLRECITLWQDDNDDVYFSTH